MRTRDVEAALHNGASYVGAIMAGGPRNLSLRDAVATLAPAKGRAKRVVVIPPGRPAEIAEVAREFDVVQLHGDASADDILGLRELYSGEIWAVVRVGEEGMPAASRDLFSVADAIVFDKQTANGLGGSGMPINWNSLSEQLGAARPRRTILAGGLNSSNVAEAISMLRPDVVDVASGVEAAPGIKNHDLLRQFFQAVRSAEAVL